MTEHELPEPLDLAPAPKSEEPKFCPKCREEIGSPGYPACKRYHKPSELWKEQRAEFEQEVYENSKPTRRHTFRNTSTGSIIETFRAGEGDDNRTVTKEFAEHRSRTGSHGEPLPEDTMDKGYNEWRENHPEDQLDTWVIRQSKIVQALERGKYKEIARLKSGQGSLNFESRIAMIKQLKKEANLLRQVWHLLKNSQCLEEVGQTEFGLPIYCSKPVKGSVIDPEYVLGGRASKTHRCKEHYEKYARENKHPERAKGGEDSTVDSDGGEEEKETASSPSEQFFEDSEQTPPPRTE